MLDLPMQEGVGTTVYDKSRYGNNGTLTNGPTWKKLPSGIWVVVCDGDDDFITLPSTWQPTRASGFAIELWWKPNAGWAENAASKLVFKGSHGLLINTSGIVALSVIGAETYTVISDDALVVGTYYHIVAKLDPSDSKLYLFRQGVLIKTGDTTAGVISDVTGNAIEIAGQAAADRESMGEVAFCRIYDYSPPNHAIRSHFQRERSLFGV